MRTVIAGGHGKIALLLASLLAERAGPGSGALRKDAVDRAASALMADAAEQAGVRRFVQVSSMGAGQPPRPGSDEVWAAYIAAKTAAEADVAAVIVALLDEPATRYQALELVGGDTPIAAAIECIV